MFVFTVEFSEQGLCCQLLA